MLHLIKFAVLRWMILALSVSISITPFIVAAEKNQSVYEVLRDHGLPMGLLPKGVKEFRFEQETGRFEVHLDQACNAKFESELHYERNVSGMLSRGKIRELSGVIAQELFLWFPVKLIRVDNPSTGVIYFDVGVVFKQFSLSLFETPRNCVAVKDNEFFAESFSEDWPSKQRPQHGLKSFARSVQ